MHALPLHEAEQRRSGFGVLEKYEIRNTSEREARDSLSLSRDAYSTPHTTTYLFAHTGLSVDATNAHEHVTGPGRLAREKGRPGAAATRSRRRGAGARAAPPASPASPRRPHVVPATSPRHPRHPRPSPAGSPPATRPWCPRTRARPRGHQAHVLGDDAPPGEVAASPVARPRDVSERLGAGLVAPHGVRDALHVRAHGALVPQGEPRTVRARVAHRALVHQILLLHAETARAAHDRELERVVTFAFEGIAKTRRRAVGRGRRVFLASGLRGRGRVRRGTHVRSTLRAPPHASRASRADEANAGTAQRDARGVPVAARHRGLRGGGDRLEAHRARRLGRIAWRRHRHRARALERSDTRGGPWSWHVMS